MQRQSLRIQHAEGRERIPRVYDTGEERKFTKVKSCVWFSECSKWMTTNIRYTML